MLELDQLAGGFLDEHLDGVLVGQPVRAADGVVDVILGAVVVLDDRRHAALGGDGVAAHRIDLGHDADAEIWVLLGHGDSGPKAGATAANDEHVVLQLVHGAHGR